MRILRMRDNIFMLFLHGIKVMFAIHASFLNAWLDNNLIITFQTWKCSNVVSRKVRQIYRKSFESAAIVEANRREQMKKNHH